MAELTGNVNNSVLIEEHDNKTHAKKVTNWGYDAVTDTPFRFGPGKLVFEKFDTIVATYPTNAIEVFTYKIGGTGGTTIATVTVTYTDSTKAVFTSVVRT